MSTLRDNEVLKIQQAEPVFTVGIVDRDSMSSGLLADALRRDKTVCVRAVRGDELLKSVASSPMDLLVIAADVKVHSRSGLDVAAHMTRMHPQTSVVVLVNCSSPDAVVNVFRCGARGVFSREASVAEFIDCIQHVRRGQVWAGRRETGILLEAIRSLPAPTPVMADDSPALTARELQVVQQAARGKTNKVIALHLGLSEHTVKNYLFRSFEKLGVSSRIELLFYLTLRGYTFGTPSAVPPQDEILNKNALA